MMDCGRLRTGYAGPLTWIFLDHSDVRCRLDHKDRPRRVLERNAIRPFAVRPAPTVPLEDSISRRRQFEEPAFIGGGECRIQVPGSGAHTQRFSLDDGL